MVGDVVSGGKAVPVLCGGNDFMVGMILRGQQSRDEENVENRDNVKTSVPIRHFLCRADSHVLLKTKPSAVAQRRHVHKNSQQTFRRYYMIQHVLPIIIHKLPPQIPAQTPLPP